VLSLKPIGYWRLTERRKSQVVVNKGSLNALASGTYKGRIEYEHEGPVSNDDLNRAVGYSPITRFFNSSILQLSDLSIFQFFNLSINLSLYRSFRSFRSFHFPVFPCSRFPQHEDDAPKKDAARIDIKFEERLAIADDMQHFSVAVWLQVTGGEGRVRTAISSGRFSISVLTECFLLEYLY
jgi:hypothetical protein